MRIIFVRHGHPDYEKDCLTEIGKKQAEAVAKRLADENIEVIFSSSCGRASETAEYIARGRGLEVQLLDFMREISWRSRNGEELYQKGNPWAVADKMVADEKSLMDPDWRNQKPYQPSIVIERSDAVAEHFDIWMSGLGYTREGEYYRVGKKKYHTVVLASHGGSSSAVLSHLLNIPLPFLFYSIRPDFTAVTVISLGDEEGSITSARIEILNDARHICELDCGK